MLEFTLIVVGAVIGAVITAIAVAPKEVTDNVELPRKGMFDVDKPTPARPEPPPSPPAYRQIPNGHYYSETKKTTYAPTAAVTKQQIVDAFMALGSVRKVCRELRMGHARVEQVLDEAGISRSKKFEPIPRERRLEIQQALESGEVSKSEVARQFGVSRFAVNKIASEELL